MAPSAPSGATPELEALTRRLLALLGRITSLDSTYLTRVDPEAGVQEVLVARNVGSLQIPEGATVGWADTLCRRALDTGIRRTTDVATDLPGSAAAAELGIVSYVTVPVTGPDGALFGTLCGASDRAVAIDDDVAEVMEVLAEMIGLHLERDATAEVMAGHADELRYRTLHDPLTGLANRVLFLERVTLACARREIGRTALLFIDLDDFKAINDTGGHARGDRVLEAVAERLRALTREGDTVARLSGDEFALLLEEVDGLAGARAAAQRVLDSLAEPLRVEGAELRLQASVGVALRDRFTIDGPMLLRYADMAMYAAKRAGKGQFRVFDDEVHSQIAGRAEVLDELRRAIDLDQLVVHYQPIVDLDDGTVIGMEALVRWRHPRRGLLAAADFIAVAEDAGLTGAIGDVVLRQACADTARWNAEHPDARRFVAVNVSARQFDPGLPRLVADAVAAAGLDPADLVIEVTETVYLAEPEGHNVRALQDLGVRVALDDFGTGFSSLSYLRRFPVDVIKIDRAFVHPAATGDDDAIIAAIVGLCDLLALDVIAEGIESAAELERLRRLGVRHGQGYHLGRPAALADDDAPVPVATAPHRCLAFADRAELVDAAVRHLAAGRRRGERLLYVADAEREADLLAELAPLGDVEQLVAEGTLGVHRFASLYPSATGFDPATQVETYRRLTEEARAAGYTGLCAVADATSLMADPAWREHTIAYERLVDDLIGSVPLRALCAYEARVLGDAHDLVVALHAGDVSPAGR